jgi:dolichol kinase
MKLHLRSELHILRRLWHMGAGIIISVTYWNWVSTNTAITILGVALGIEILGETLRLRVPKFNEKVLKILGPIMRTREVNRMSAIPHYLVATILVIAIFPQPVAILSILYLACGDPIASIAGIQWGHLSIRIAPGKSLVGTLAGVTTCFFITLIFMSNMQVSAPVLIIVSIIGGIVGGMAELIPLEMDDNFTIPVISGFLMWMTFLIFRI